MGNVITFSAGDPEGMRKALKRLFQSQERRRSPTEQAEMDEFVRQLNEAAQRGDRHVFEALLEPAATELSEKDGPSEKEPSLVLWAAMEGHAEILDGLLSAGARPDEVYMGLSPLSIAAEKGHIDIVRRLIAAGASVSQPGLLEQPLSAAVKGEHRDAIDILLRAGADVDAASWAGTPLLNAVKSGNLQILQQLVDAGADVQMKWMAGNNLVAEAVGADLSEAKRQTVIQRLIELGVSANAINNFGRTPLMLAVEAGHESTVDFLLSCGADPNVAATAPSESESTKTFSSSDRSTALILAARSGQVQIAARLLAAGAAVDRTDTNNLTALHWAKRNGHSNVVAMLMDAGAEADVSSPEALLSATCAGDAAAVRAAIAAGVDVNTRDRAGPLGDCYGFTPLIAAAMAGNQEIVSILLQAGADIELQSHPFPASTNPLMAAAKAGYIDVVRQLLDAGADLNAKNKGFEGGRMQPLHFAASGGRAAVAKLLLDRGAKLHAKTADRETPLHLAARSGNLETVQLLLDAGANPHAKNESKQTPRDTLRHADKKNAKIGPVLQAAEAAVPRPTKKAKPKPQRVPVIPHEWEEAPWELERPDFTDASSRDTFQAAVDFMIDALGGVKPTEEPDFPGARFFRTRREAAADVATNCRQELAQFGAMAVHGLGRGSFRDDDPDILMLLPTTDWVQAVAFVQTADPNGGKGPGQIVAGLKQLFELRPFFLTEIAHDKIAGFFTAPAENSRALAKWMEEFCSDIVSQGVGSVSELARQLKTGNQLYFWWD